MNMRTAQRTHILKENRLKEKNIPRGNPTLLSTVDLPQSLLRSGFSHNQQCPLNPYCY